MHLSRGIVFSLHDLEGRGRVLYPQAPVGVGHPHRAGRDMEGGEVEILLGFSLWRWSHQEAGSLAARSPIGPYSPSSPGPECPQVPAREASGSSPGKARLTCPISSLLPRARARASGQLLPLGREAIGGTAEGHGADGGP